MNIFECMLSYFIIIEEHANSFLMIKQIKQWTAVNWLQIGSILLWYKETFIHLSDLKHMFSYSEWEIKKIMAQNKFG